MPNTDTGIVRAAVNDGKNIRVYFTDDTIPANYDSLFSNYGTARIERLIAPYVVVECRNKRLAAQCQQYALKFDNWDTGEAINWAQNDEPLWKECDRLARKYKDRPIRAQSAITGAIRSSDILEGTGVRVRFVAWSEVANVFLSSIE